MNLTIKFLLVMFVAAFVSVCTNLCFAKGAELPRTYIVQKGDTLSGIAQQFFGSYREYHRLAKMNGLEIETINNIDYVWLQIGQVIKLRKDDMDKKTAMHIANTLIEDRVGWYRNPRHGSSSEAEYTYHANVRHLASLPLTESARHHDSIRDLMAEITEAMHDYGTWMVIEDFLTGVLLSMPVEYTGDDILEVSLQLMALLEIETGYRNVPGSHGEIGWYQVKPRTWEYFTQFVFGKYFTDSSFNSLLFFEKTATVMEEHFISATVWSGLLLRYLKETEGTFFKAMARYNNGKDKLKYAKRVVNRYKHLSTLANKIRREHE